MSVLAGVSDYSYGTGRWEGQPGGGLEQAVPIRKHILLVSGSVAGLLFVAVGYALLFTKNSLKNNHFLSAERQGNGSSHTRAYTHFLVAGILLSRTCHLWQRHQDGLGSREVAKPTLLPQACLLLSSAWLPQAVLRSVTQPILTLSLPPELLCFPLL